MNINNTIATHQDYCEIINWARLNAVRLKRVLKSIDNQG